MNTLVPQIERLSMRAWPALEEEWLDGWLLRAAQGYTDRANSVNPALGFHETYRYWYRILETTP